MSEPKFRKTETMDDRDAVATYSVLVGDVVVGTVTKHQHRPWKQQKNGKLRHRTETYWSWQRDDLPEDTCGYETRAYAVRALEKDRGRRQA
mgnify:CR=1 FL=1